MKKIDSRYFNIARAFVNTHELTKDEYFKRVFHTAFKVIPEAQKGSFFELVGHEYLPIFSKGYEKKLINKLRFTRDNFFVDFDIKERDIVVVNQIEVKKREHRFTKDYIDTFKKLGTYEGFISLYATIRHNGEVIGLLSLENFENEAFSEDSVAVLKIYAQFISNFYALKMYQEEEIKKHYEIINALISVIELKDPYTEGHSKRVMSLSTKFALVLGMDHDTVRRIRIAALLHDIGKVGVPDSILNKPSQLTEAEYAEIKKHPDMGAKILSKIDKFDDVIEITRCHHEHYDGTGYPNGLKEDQIPIEAQIIQIVDAYDAMTSQRAYRQPFSKEKALNIILEQKGKQFHPELSISFVKYINPDI